MTRRFEGTARLVYCLLLLQKALRLRARTVYRTVAGSSPAAGAIESLGSPRLFYFHRIGGQTRHPIINREIHGEDLTTTHIRQTGHCQFTDERHGIPSISLEIPRRSTSRPGKVRAWRSIRTSGALGPPGFRPGSRRAWRPWHRCRCKSVDLGYGRRRRTSRRIRSSLARSCELAKAAATISVLRSYAPAAARGLTRPARWPRNQAGRRTRRPRRNHSSAACSLSPGEPRRS